MPKPVTLSAHVYDNERSLKNSPLAAYVTSISVKWERVENNVCGLFNSLLNRPFDAALISSMYNEVVNLRARTLMLQVVGKERLPEDMYKELVRLIKKIKEHKDRNYLIHSLWTASPEYPDALIRIPNWRDHRVGEPPPQHLAYEQADFERVESNLDRLSGRINTLLVRWVEIAKPDNIIQIPPSKPR